MLRSHGIVTVGPTLESACNTAVNMEDAALMYWMARMIGQPTPLPAASLLRRKTLWANPEFASSVWSYYEQLGARDSGARSTSRSRIRSNPR
jgi:ribulose-5-phosphate 4-epimerase/fuculose-1-phosphate aldolase